MFIQSCYRYLRRSRRHPNNHHDDQDSPGDVILSEEVAAKLDAAISAPHLLAVSSEDGIRSLQLKKQAATTSTRSSIDQGTAGKYTSM
jgi:hypothetical protein